jgi:hypothetical protein
MIVMRPVLARLFAAALFLFALALALGYALLLNA